MYMGGIIMNTDFAKAKPIYIENKRPMRVGLVRVILVGFVSFLVGWVGSSALNTPNPHRIAAKHECSEGQVQEIIKSRLQIALDGGYASIPTPKKKPAQKMEG